MQCPVRILVSFLDDVSHIANVHKALTFTLCLSTPSPQSFFLSRRKVELFVKRWEPVGRHTGYSSSSSSSSGTTTIPGKESHSVKGGPGKSRADATGRREADRSKRLALKARQLRGIVVYLHGYGGTSWDSMRGEGSGRSDTHIWR